MKLDREPINEGSALAIGMIDFLSQQGTTCIATTHYPLIKAMFLNTPL